MIYKIYQIRSYCMRPLHARRKSPAFLARSELLDAIREGSSDFERLGALVDCLVDARLPFREQLLGGGPWQVSAVVEIV